MSEREKLKPFPKQIPSNQFTDEGFAPDTPMPERRRKPNELSVDEASAVVAASFQEDHDSDVFETAIKRLGDWVDVSLGLHSASKDKEKR